MRANCRYPRPLAEPEMTRYNIIKEVVAGLLVYAGLFGFIWLFWAAF